MKENSKEIGLEDKVKIDLLVVGSVAVSRQGRHDIYFSCCSGTSLKVLSLFKQKLKSK